MRKNKLLWLDRVVVLSNIFPQDLARKIAAEVFPAACEKLAEVIEGKLRAVELSNKNHGLTPPAAVYIAPDEHSAEWRIKAGKDANWIHNYPYTPERFLRAHGEGLEDRYKDYVVGMVSVGKSYLVQFSLEKYVAECLRLYNLQARRRLQEIGYIV